MIYEMHVGTFTREGTWAAAARASCRSWPSSGSPCSRSCPSPSSPAASAGATTASTSSPPTTLYGEPDDFRRFVDRAHAAGHRRDPRRGLQPPRAGRQLPQAVLRRATSRTATRPTGARRSTSTARTPGRCASSILANAGYWIDEFHLDGLRLDATQDDLRRLAGPHPRRHRPRGRARRRAARSILIVAENEPQDTRLVRPPAAGGLRPRRALERRLPPHRAWSPSPAATRPTTRDYRGTPQELISAGQARLPLPGAALRLAGEAPRAPRPRPAGRRPSSPSSRTTTRWPTPPAASGCHQLTAPGRASGR